MSEMKLIDSTQLDTDLTSVANAIRTKGGTNADLAFPAGFVSAVEAISRVSIDDMISGAWPSGDIVYDSTATPIDYALAYRKHIGSLTITNATNLSNYFAINSSVTSVTAPFVTTAMWYGFTGCSSLSTISFPRLKAIPRSLFESCKMPVAVFPAITGNIDAYSFRFNTSLLAFDVGNVNLISVQAFQGDSALNLIIIRQASKVPGLGNVSVFTGTPFNSGGTGGTIYIPKVLYDHLGDGTSLDYKAATNWSTVDGYGTITWAQIEGSIYETQYADGTSIT